jgi:hypothetical protein
MVSKLLLAVGECIQASRLSGVPDDTCVVGCSSPFVSRLIAHYREIREGIGSHKSPAEYGSFPFDAYSHTPSYAGVQQPGMTGQVKEDIISRFFELGICVQDGEIHIHTDMLRAEDFLNGELHFTYCGIPFCYVLSDETKIRFEYRDGQSICCDGSVISVDLSAQIFARDSFIQQVILYVNNSKSI